MSLNADRSYKMKLRDVENAFKYRRIPYPKRSVELIALLAISCTFFLFMHTNKLNSRLKEMEVKLQPSEFSALGLTGNHISGHDAGKHDDINTLHGTYQYLKSTGQLWQLNASHLNNTQLSSSELLFFNRVPRTGGRTLIELLSRLGELNQFMLEHTPYSRPIVNRLNAKQQSALRHYVSDLAKSTPIVYVEPVGFIDFRGKGLLAPPIYVNLVRDPVEKVISWYYHRRTPWTALSMYKTKGKFHKRDFYTKSFEDCVLRRDAECRYDAAMGFQADAGDHKRQSLFFCGHAKICEPFNTPAAIALAKQHVEQHFAVVGSWEDVNVTLTVLEDYIPRFFKGASELYFAAQQELSQANHWKPPISEHIKSLVRANFTYEYEFYYFCKQRLYQQYLTIKRH